MLFLVTSLYISTLLPSQPDTPGPTFLKKKKDKFLYGLDWMSHLSHAVCGSFTDKLLILTYTFFFFLKAAALYRQQVPKGH